MQPVGLRATVGHQVAAQLAARGLDGHVGLALGHLEPLGEQLEVVDQGLHRLVYAAARRRGDLLVLHPVVAGRHEVDDLLDDVQALAHLLEADRVAVEGVTVGADDHVELELVVGHVGLVAPEVPVDAGGAQQGARGGEGDGLLGRDHTHALGALGEDRLAGEEDVVLVETGRDGLAQLEDVGLPAGREVGGGTARSDEVVVHPQARDLLEERQDQLPLAPPVDHHGDGAEVHAVGGHEEQVAGDPVQLHQQHPDPDGAGRQLDAEQLLDRHAEHRLVRERGEVVHPGHVRAALDVHQVLTGALHPGVQVAHDRLGAQDGLAVELEHEAEHTVGAGVLGPHVDDHRLVLADLGDEVAGVERRPLGQAERGAGLPQELQRVGLRPAVHLLGRVDGAGDRGPLLLQRVLEGVDGLAGGGGQRCS